MSQNNPVLGICKFVLPPDLFLPSLSGCPNSNWFSVSLSLCVLASPPVRSIATYLTRNKLPHHTGTGPCRGSVNGYGRTSEPPKCNRSWTRRASARRTQHYAMTWFPPAAEWLLASIKAPMWSCAVLSALNSVPSFRRSAPSYCIWHDRSVTAAHLPETMFQPRGFRTLSAMKSWGFNQGGSIVPQRQVGENSKVSERRV